MIYQLVVHVSDDNHGFVIIRDVFSPETCKATIDDMWFYLKDVYDIDRNDSSTWENKNWRQKGNRQFVKQVLFVKWQV